MFTLPVSPQGRRRSNELLISLTERGATGKVEMLSDFYPVTSHGTDVNQGNCRQVRRSTKQKEWRTPRRWSATPSFPLERVDFPKLTTSAIVVGMMSTPQLEINV